MRLERQLFHSRLARRVFGLFLAASLVPLLALAFLLLRETRRALEEQAFAQLETATRSYGQFTLDKLLAAGNDLHDTAALVADALDAVALAGSGTVQPVLGDWTPPLGTIALDDARPTVVVIPRGDRAEVVIARRSGASAIYGRLAPTQLPDPQLDAAMEACILSSTMPAVPIHCSTALPPAAIAEIAQRRQHGSAGRLTWRNAHGEQLATYWQLFLPSRFSAEPWTIVVSQPRDTALASLAIFNRVVPQAALATLVLIALLAISQIRRTLRPLDELVAGTKRIAAQDFSTPVRIDTGDEFAMLGEALNGMAEQLHQQFGALRALAAIDRAILQTTDIEPVLATLFARLDEVVPDGRHLVVAIDADNPEHGLVYRNQAAQRIERERIDIGPQLGAWLAEAAPDRVTDAATLAAVALPVGTASNDQQALVVPLMTGHTPSGALVTLSRSGAALRDGQRASIRELAARVAVAISAGKREAELFRRAHFDALTGLPNRELLHDRLHQAIAQAQRDDHLLAVLFIDLDGFKEINDSFGHRCGDELLKETALRLSTVLRHGDTVARLGGDEYAILLPQLATPLEAEAVAAKTITAVCRPFAVDGREAYVSASIGLAMFPDDGRAAAELLRRADMAMYTAKGAGKSCYRFFAEEMDRRIQERHALHYDLRGALAAGEFALSYQPQLDLRTGRLVSAEALLRWRHPSRGSISPALFIPILEQTGLIKEVGAWALRKALADFAGWQRAGLSFERVAVNVSARQLLDRDFAAGLAQAVAAAGLVGQHLEIELTEASLVADFPAANEVLAQLREHGVRIALDDFGTGYSSLAYLNELAFDTLKIDRAFVVNLPAEKSIAIIKAIVAVADSLGKEVVAEGIESQLQYGQLAALGCGLGQGFLIAPPLGETELIAFAASRGPAAAGAAEPPRRVSGGRT
jgi:diguanylate cyclase (GGDEF)-like protein